ncbi:MAG TPA: UPF0182 family protein [Chloroflexia bacterium]
MSNRGGTNNKSAAQDAPPRRSGGWRSRLAWILGIGLFLFIILPSIFAEMVTDWMWFGSQNLSEVYTTRLWLGLGVFFLAAIVAALFCALNWLMAWRVTQPSAIYPGQSEPFPPRFARVLIIGAAIVIAFIMGLAAADEWPTILLFVNSVPFGQTDPLFNNDIGFYVFGLPFYAFLRGWATGLLVVTAIGAAIIYLIGVLPRLNRAIAEAQARAKGIEFKLGLDNRVGTHLSILGAVFLLLVAIGYWLDTFELLYSSRAFAYGAGYTDVNAKLPSLYIMMGVAVVMAVLLLVNMRVRTWKLLGGALAIWLLALVLVGGAYPAFVQGVIVRPNEYELEKPFIENNIVATRRAFGLDKFQEREVAAVDTVTQQQIAANPDTISNIRLWDYRPLLDTYSQIQVIRSYYTFKEVDIDRYTLAGKQQQVMLSARELTAEGLNEQIRTWQNQHFVYTHGYGVVVSPVNEIEGEGLPKLLVKNVPPETDVPELRLTRPEIYYGEQTDQYIFVNSGAQEFDYPQGDANKYTVYQGKGGVEMSGFLTKLLFTVRFGDGNIMLSPLITPQTRAIFHRNIHDAVRLLAPFLLYDSDPYLVVSNGALYWIQDAYTATDRYPYSSPNPNGINYIRNSVKVVINAYDGSATFYVADDTDPLVRAYRGIFPALFKDISEMPAGIRSHIRYPEDLMNIQADMYSTFHMTDPQVFYSKEDVWNVPFGTQSEGSEPLEAYYVNMQLPGEEKQGFMLILPFTPTGRDNMIAWMAGKSDGEDYGKVQVIRYPKQQLVYGPNQVEARINQDPLISQQITLWSQSGSRVRRGNLLTIPIGNSVLYVEPLFLQAETSKFPELKRVIAVTGNSVGIGSDLREALNVAFKLQPGQVIGSDGGETTPQATPLPGLTPAPTRTPRPAGTPGTASPADLTQSALEHYDLAQTALRDGDLATYQREIDAMKRDLDELARIVGVPTALPSTRAVPTVTPTP